MTELSGGHWFDTGDGLVSVDPPTEDHQAAEEPVGPSQPLTGFGVENPREITYRTYITHLQACSQCIRSVFRCATGNELWNAYTSAR